jgi:hypothetical protein
MSAVLCSETLVVQNRRSFDKCQPARAVTKRCLIPSLGRSLTNRQTVDRTATKTRALSVDPLFLLAEGAPGTVDAPLPVVAGAAILVSAAALLVFTFGLKPGTDAAIEMQQRDARSGRFRGKDKK